MVNMMQSLRKEIQAEFAACVFDARGPTFRDALYDQYKAQRAPMPDDLRAQIRRSMRWCG
jgi:DNA polymerase-1